MKVTKRIKVVHASNSFAPIYNLGDEHDRRPIDNIHDAQIAIDDFCTLELKEGQKETQTFRENRQYWADQRKHMRVIEEVIITNDITHKLP